MTYHTYQSQTGAETMTAPTRRQIETLNFAYSAEEIWFRYYSDRKQIGVFDLKAEPGVRLVGWADTLDEADAIAHKHVSR